MTATETELERTVREEQQAHDEANETTEDDEQQEHEGGGDTDDAELQADPDAAGQTAAFDKSQYDREDLQIAKIDGQSIDRIKVKFAGEIHLDRSDPADVKLYNELKFGRDVAMLIEGRCNKTGAEGATDREGDLDVVIGHKGVKIHSISKPAGADWVQDAK